MNLGIWITSIVMLFGVLFFNWSAQSVIYAYIFETIIIGLIHIVKMILVVLFSEEEEKKKQEKGQLVGIYSVFFFCIHYFFFVTIQMLFVFQIMNIEYENNQISSNFLEFGKNFKYLFSIPDMKEAYTLIFAGNIYHTLKNYVIPKLYRKDTVAELFMQPYLRVIVQQFVAILGGFFLIIANGAKAIAVILIIVRTFVDLIGISISQNKLMVEKVYKVLYEEKKGRTEEQKQEIKRAIEKMFR